MTEISPLRRRMIDDMMVRNLSLATQRSYVHAVAKFGRFSAARRSALAWRMTAATIAFQQPSPPFQLTITQRF